MSENVHFAERLFVFKSNLGPLIDDQVKHTYNRIYLNK